MKIHSITTFLKSLFLCRFRDRISLLKTSLKISFSSFVFVSGNTLTHAFRRYILGLLGAKHLIFSAGDRVQLFSIGPPDSTLVDALTNEIILNFLYLIFFTYFYFSSFSLLRKKQMRKRFLC